MIHATFPDALSSGCKAVGIEVPRKTIPGKWVQCPVAGKPRTNTSGRVMVFDDGRGGVCWNWATGKKHTFRIGEEGASSSPARRRDSEKERREQEERAEVERVCADIVRTCDPALHPYLARKGFPAELGLVHEAPWRCFPATPFGEALARALPEGEGPLLIVPGRIGKRVTTVQFITPEGAKKNILRGAMSGASHRIATGRLTVVCEGIATALSIRAALRLLGSSATVLSAFSAANVAKVAAGIPAAIIAADHDKPIEALHGKGTGEFYAAGSGCAWSMPPALGDFNDMHQAEGLREVAMHLREVLSQ